MVGQRLGQPPGRAIQPAKSLSRLLGVLLVALATNLVFPLAPGHGDQVTAESGATTGDQSTGSGRPFVVQSEEVLATYDPSTGLLTVTCAISFRARENLTQPAVALPPAATGASIANPGSSYPWRLDGSTCRPDPIVGAGVEDTFALNYSLVPQVEHDNGLFCTAFGTSKMFILQNQSSWLPTFMGATDEARLNITLAVPSGWTAFAPGLAPGGPLQPGTTSRGTTEEETYCCSAAFSEMAPVWAIIAGAYSRCGSGEAYGVSYEVWALPRWVGDGDRLLATLPDAIGFLSDHLGSLPSCRLTFLELSEQAASGQTFHWHITDPTVTLGMGQSRWSASQVSIEQIWVHELTHALPEFGPREELATFMGDWYVRERLPELGSQVWLRRLDYYLNAVREYGLQPNNAAEQAGVSDAYYYSRGALVWGMFQGLFGEEATETLLRRLNSDGLKYDSQGGPMTPSWDETVREAAAETLGPQAARFFEIWLHTATAPQLDYAVQNVRADDAAGTVEFLIRDLTDDPTARTAVPEVEVGIRLDSGEAAPNLLTARVKLTGEFTSVKLEIPSRPLRA